MNPEQLKIEISRYHVRAYYQGMQFADCSTQIGIGQALHIVAEAIHKLQEKLEK